MSSSAGATALALLSARCLLPAVGYKGVLG